MAKKFALVLGLHNLFNITDSVYDVSSLKSNVSSLIDLDSVAYIIADSTDGPVTTGTQAHPVVTYKSVTIGNMTDATPINVGDAFIWTQGKIYSGNTLAGGGGGLITWNVTGDDWIDAEFISNNDGSVDVTINHQNTATGVATNAAQNPSATDDGHVDVRGTSTTGGQEVITSFTLDANGHVKNVHKKTIYVPQLKIALDGSGDTTSIDSGDGKYLSGVSFNSTTNKLTFVQKDNGIFSGEGLNSGGNHGGEIVVVDDSNDNINEAKSSGVTIEKQGSATGSVLTSSDTKIPTSKAVLEAIRSSVVPTVVFKGTTSVLPSSNVEEGDMWKIVPASGQTTISLSIPANKSADGEAHTAKQGDTIIADDSNPAKWWYIPSGDDVEDTWRAIKVNDTAWKGGQLNTGDLNFKNGTAITVSGSNDDLTITHNKITRTDTTGTATTLSHGGNFTVVTGTTSNNQGHVTGVETTQFTLPAGANNGELYVGSDSGNDQVVFSADQSTDSKLNIEGGAILTSTVSKSGNNVNVKIDHDELTTAQKTAVAPSDPTTNTNIDLDNGATVVISGVTVNDYGHVTSVSKTKITSTKVNDATLTLTGNNTNKTVVIRADNGVLPTSGGSADSFTANDSTNATYYVYYTGASDATDWASIGYSS